MELSVRDWMIVVGVLLIVVVLLDGYRRVRNERRGNIRMSLNRSFLNSSEEDGSHSSELPNGGARVIGEREFQKYNRQGGSHDGEPQIGDEDLDLSQAVPLLMESVESDVATADDSVVDSTPSALDKEDSGTSSYITNNEIEPKGRSTYEEQEIEEVDDSPFQHNLLSEDPEEAHRVSSKKRESYDSNPQEVFVINVNAKNEMFKGPDLLHILLACDLRFGDMNIFHRHENANGTGAVQFSMANSVHPGTFDLEAIDDFSSPSVSFFMSIPGPNNPMQAFDYMVETAQCLVKNLDGELRDESRSVMTLQTLEHCRQRIRDAERRQLTQNA
jgi:cell division protein ZipA